MSAELLNQYTTLLGWSHGFQESDPVARPLLSTSPILETALVLAIPVSLIATAYHTGLKWTDSNHMHRKAVTTTTLLLALLLGISSTIATINDLNTLHAYHIL
jgi:hypothetical protein